jgi:LmbE family N-acetylglucosaminyl deacetylase
MTTRLLGVFAHPDDDVYTLGATLLAHREDLETTLVFATSGEAGPITDPEAVSREELGQVREGEQRAAMEALGVGTTTDARFLRLPDYFLPDVAFDDLVQRIAAIVREVQPQIVITFGPDGITSHHDHIRAGEAATAAFDQLAATDDAEAPTRLFHTALPRSSVDRFYAALEDGGYGNEGELFNVTGVPDERITVRFDARRYRETKLAAILEHRTQLSEWERIPEPLRWIFLDEEAFVQARPPTEAGSPLDDLLAAAERSA